MSYLSLSRIEELRLLPGEEWTETAARWCFLRVTRGAAYWLGAPRQHVLAEGELVVIPPSAPGVVRASQIGEVRLQGLGFAPEMLRGLLTAGERRLFEHGEVPWEVQFLPSTHPVTQRFAALAASHGPHGELTRRADALCLLAEVVEGQAAAHHLYRTPGVDARHRFEQLLATMPDEQLMQQTVAALARLCGCSPRHFSRLFQRRFGESVRLRQTELRLLKAQKLLETTSGPIGEIAHASGYRNVSLFNLLFKRRFGLTPSGCREQARSNQPT